MAHFWNGAQGYPSHLNYSASLAGEGRLLAFSSLLLMAYSVVSDTMGSNRVHRHDSELLNSPFFFSSSFRPLLFTYLDQTQSRKRKDFPGAVSQVKLGQKLTQLTECQGTTSA